MPNWKKLIVSGSDANLNSLNVTTSITGSDVKIDDWGSISGSLANLTDNTPDGSGTANYITKWSDSDTLTDSSISDDGSTINLFANSTGNTGVVNIYGEGGVPPTLQVLSRTNRAKLKIADNDTAINIIAEGSIGSFGFGSTSSSTSNLSILSSGNVGIGTTSPSEKLNVDGNVQITTGGNTYLKVDHGNVGFIQFTDTSIATPNRFLIQHNYAQDNDFRIARSTGGQDFVINTDGNVGIGTSSPSDKLEVSGDIRTTGALKLFNSTNHYGTIDADSEGLTLDTVANRHLRFLQNGNEAMRINTSSNVGIGTSLPTEKLEVLGGLVINSGFNTGIASLYLSHTANQAQHKAGIFTTYTTGYGRSSSMQFALNSEMNSNIVTTADAKMTIVEDGKVGIGTSSPQDKLDVQGDVRVSYNSSNYFTIEPISNGNVYFKPSGGSIHIAKSAKNNQIFLYDYTGSTARWGEYEASSIALKTSTNTTGIFLNTDGNSYINVGNVGIGTTAPNNKLDVRRSNSGIVAEFHSTAGTADEYVDVKLISGNTTSGTYGTILRHQRVGTSGADFAILTNPTLTGTPVERFRITKDGNVGIGTSSPASTLHVSSSTFNDHIKLGRDSDVLGITVSGGQILLEGGASPYVNDTMDLGRSDKHWRNLYINDNIYVSESAVLNLQGGLNVTGDVTVAGKITAQEFHTEFVSASIMYESGSTKFGDTSDDNHDFTGSLNIAGDVNINSNYPAHTVANDLTIGKTTTGDHGLTIVTSNTNTAAIYFGDNDHNDAGRIRYQHSNNAMRFDTNRSEAMRIDSSGNVGIGTTSPNAKLHIGPNSLVSGYTPDRSTLAISDTTNGGQLIIRGQSPRIWFDGTAGGNAELFLDDSKLNILSGRPGAEGSSRLYIKADGNVGIGTTSPTGLLEIMSTTNPVLRISNGGGTSPNPKIELYRQGGVLGNIQYSAANKVMILENQSTLGGFDFNIASSTKMAIDLNGNVGIGTTTPDEKLHVFGGAAAIKIDSTTNEASLEYDNSTTTATIKLANNDLKTELGGSERMRIKSSGQVQLPDYGSGTFTGTLQSTLGVDSSGNIIEFTGGGGGSVSAITSGADTRVAYFNGTDSLEGSANFTWDDTALSIIGNVSVSSTKAFRMYNAANNGWGEMTYVEADNRIQFNRGIQNSGADFLLSEDSTNSFVSANQGNFGIGTTSPQGVLHIDKGASTSNTYIQGNAAYTDWLRQSYSIGSAGLRIGVDSSNNHIIRTLSAISLKLGTNNSDSLIIDPSGNVGIGNTSPSHNLVVGDGTTDTESRFYHNDASYTSVRGYGLFMSRSNSYIRPVNDGSQTLYIGTDSKTWGTLSADANTFSLNRDGVTRLRINSAGNVGIGTTTPATKLDVAGTAPVIRLTDTRNLNVGDWDDVSLGKIQFHTSDTTSPGARTLAEIEAYSSVDAASGPEAELRFKTSTITDSSAQTRMIIDASGKIGIGTTSPGSKLHVEGSIQLGSGAATDDNSLIIYGNNGTASRYIKLIHHNASSSSIQTNNTYLSISAANYIVLSNNTLIYQGVKFSNDKKLEYQESDNSYFTVLNVNSSNLIQIGSVTSTSTGGDTAFYHTGVEKMRIISTGHVGIGTSNPLYKLDVDGDIQNNGVLRRGGNVYIKNTGSETMIGPGGSGIITFHNSATMTAGDEKVRIDASGNLLLNNTSAGARLDIREDTNYAIRAEDATGHYFRVNTGGDVDMRGDLVVQGTITAQQFHSEFVSASIIYDSGSTKFGDTSDDNHDFTGSLNLLGSAEITGDIQLVNKSDALIFGSVGSNGTWGAPKIGRIDSNLIISDYSGVQLGGYDGTAYGPRMTVKGTGNVGIGITSPQQKLHVAGNGRFESGATGLGGYVTVGNPQETAGNYSAYFFGNTIHDNLYMKGAIAYETLSSTNGRGDMHFLQNSAANGTNASISNSVMTILNSGNVGIGTTAPGNKLDVNGTFRATGAGAIQGRLSVGTSSSSDIDMLRAGSNYITATNAAGILHFRTVNDIRMTILANGNVGIGTTNPNHKLDVLGTIRGTGTTSRLILDNTQGQSFQIYAWTSGINIYNNSSTNPNVYFGRDAGTANNFYFTRNGTDFTMRVDTANERVGIGTTSMGYTLDVESDDNIIANFESTTNKGAIRISDDDTVGFISAENGRIGFGTSPILSTANITMLTSNDNVGIGNTSPAYKLSVEGGISAGGKVTYTKSAGSLDTTGYAVAGLTAASNGASAGFTFTCYGHGGYQKVVYSCYNVSGTWNTVKVIDEGTNTLDIEASANGSTITFTFKSRSGTKYYTPRVTIEATGTSINNTYA